MTRDVIIVGGGPAGASAAVAMGQKGLSDVLLLDRSRFPRDKTCGSGLSPNALKMAGELGIGDELRRLANPIQTVKLVTRGGREMVLGSNAAAVVLLRRDFDNLLIERAKRVGVELQEGVHVTEAIREEGRVVGVRSQDGREHRARVVLFADGSHSIFSTDPRPKPSISTLMGWWEGADFVPGQLEMIFDRNVAPLYGWLFPETATRVNIGICIDGHQPSDKTPKRNLRQIFADFLRDHYGGRLKKARQIGKLQGHPIVYTTWIESCTAPGALYVGEAARVTNNATGEGISQAMQSGWFAAEAVAEVLSGQTSETDAWQDYTRKHRKRFTPEFLTAHALRKAIDSPLLDQFAAAYSAPFIRKSVVRLLGSALAGSSVREDRPQ
jgi:menaquinone-9 beta-reductase